MAAETTDGQFPMNAILGDYDDIITRYSVCHFYTEPESSRFKAEIQFTDNSILMVKDYIFPTGRKYAYHWQDGGGNLIIRWDNAPHWPDIRTYPHHVHIVGISEPVESDIRSITDVMDAIKKKVF